MMRKFGFLEQLSYFLEDVRAVNIIFWKWPLVRRWEGTKPAHLNAEQSDPNADYNAWILGSRVAQREHGMNGFVSLGV